MIGLRSFAGLLLADPTSVERVDPDDLSRSFGKGYAPAELTAIAASNVAAINLLPRKLVYGDSRTRSGNAVQAIGNYTQSTGFSAEGASVSGAALERITRWYREEKSSNLLHAIDEIIFAFNGITNIEPTNASCVALTITGDAGVTMALGNEGNFVIAGGGGNAITGTGGVDRGCPLDAANDNAFAEGIAA
jgi:hypothetical protein